MKIKKIVAGSMKEALLLVKAELGEDAMILKTRKIPGKIMGKTGEQIEVTAAIDEDREVAPSSVPDLSMKGNHNSEYLALLKKESRIVPPQPKPTVPPQIQREDARIAVDQPKTVSEPRDPMQIMKIHDELSEMKQLLSSILATGETKASGGFAGPWAILYKRLSDSEIRDDLARDLLGRLRDVSPNPGRNINRDFISALAESFPCADTEQKRIQVFVGPTGSGKTTTIAKLAAYYSLEKQKKVSLITADTYRIAAVEQLRSFADIVGIDLQVIFSPEEAADAIEACSGSDIILVDTAGRSQKNREHMDELGQFLSSISPDALHLVLSAGVKESDLRDMIFRYRKYGVNRLVITKLDETLRLGNVFNVVDECRIPVSYFTFGQSVPDDIETAHPGLFIKRLLQGSSL